MSTPFEGAAQTIIKDSIRSVVFVDEELRRPLDADWPNAEREKNLYRSFYENNRSLVDFVKFNPDDLASLPEYFNKRDLLLLDWNLSAGDTEHDIPFSILRDIVEESRLHFCCIYTAEDDKRNGKILSQIFAHFSGIEIPDNIYQGLDEKLDEIFDGWEEKKINVLSLCLEFFLSSNDKKKCADIRMKLVSKFLDNSEEKFESLVNVINDGTTNYRGRESTAIIRLCFAGYNWKVKSSQKKYRVEISPDGSNLLIDNLVLLVIPKGTPESASKIFDEISDALSKSSNIFLTIFGLEMRNKFLRSPSFITDDVKNISLESFFYHRSTHKDFFDDYIKDLWANHSMGFWYSDEMETIKHLDDYLSKNDELKKRVDGINAGNGATIKDLAALNYVYNRLRVNKVEGSKVGFGDIFEFTQEDETLYALCITPLCDCIRPDDKLDSNFYFVFGHEIDISRIISGDPETDYITFLKGNNGDIKAIKWKRKKDKDEAKPLTLYIKDFKFSNAKTIVASYSNAPLDLTYVMTLKQNYAQRIANYAFSYTLRVGVDFASIKKKHNPDHYIVH